MIVDALAASKTLLALKQLGVRLSIDDFGTGYSSLAYLHSFAVDTLKIDRSFISTGDRTSESWKIVDAIARLAHELGMTATAEGIESQEQLTQAKASGCDFAQGYYFYKPLPPESLAELLRSASQTLP
jgi:EAL domain-containing protein (putative c-di-GMP-specific phosphodiesterase class I)